MSGCHKWIFVLLCFLPIFSHAQIDTIREPYADSADFAKVDTLKAKRPLIKKRAADTLYIRQYPEYLSLGLFTATPYTSIGMSPLTDSLRHFGSAFEGNYSAALGFSFGYRSVGFSYGVRLPVDPIQAGQMGRSAFKVFSIKIKKLPFIISLDYRRYKGFYDSNTMEYNPNTTKELPYTIRPDLTFRAYSGSMICNLSWRRYSYSAPINYSDRQIKTRFGFLMKCAVSYFQLASDTSFISHYQAGYFPDFFNVKTIDAIVFKTGPGVGMNLVFFKRMYFSLNLFLMGNSLIYRYTDESGKLNPWQYNANYFFEGAGALGYNSKRFYIGLRIGGDNNVMRIRGAEVKTNFGSIAFDMGFRFNAPSIFEKVWKRTLTKYLRL